MIKNKIHNISLFIVLFAAQAIAQNSTDKTITENGKKFYRHIVKKGETIYAISKEYNVAARDIVMENPRAMEGISAGDTLRIPFAAIIARMPDTVSDRSSGKYIYHKVLAKETLYSLSKFYKVSISTLDSINPELNTKGLQTGQTLKIPALSSPIASDNAKETKAFKNLVNQQHADSTKKTNIQPIFAPSPIAHPTFPAVPTTVDKTNLLNRYSIALIMPFTSESTDTIKMNLLLDGTETLPIYTQISIDFYQGVMIALDSLEKKGIKTALHLYNISSSADSSSARLDSIFKDPGISTTNLIIGPPSTSRFKIAERFAEQHGIPIISPIVADNGILQASMFASKVTPTSSTEIEKMADYIITRYSNSNIILLHRNDAADEVYFDEFKNHFNTAKKVLNENDSVNITDYTDNLEKLGHCMKEDKNNVIVAPYQNASFVAKLVNKLANSKYAEKDSIVLFGMHNWLNNDNLEMADLDTLNFHFPSNEYINYSDSCTIGFINTYRNNYFTEPSYFAYQGFDIAFFYVSQLGKYGTGLQNHLGDTPYCGVHTSFDMHRESPNGGYDNKAVYILEYRNYTEVKD